MKEEEKRIEKWDVYIWKLPLWGIWWVTVCGVNESKVAISRDVKWKYYYDVIDIDSFKKDYVFVKKKVSDYSETIWCFIFLFMVIWLCVGMWLLFKHIL